MHARNLAELVARIVLTTEEPFTRERLPDVDNVKQYWTASRCRLNAWQLAFKQLEAELQEADPLHDPWPATVAVVEEVLVSEVVTRVWSAVLAHYDMATQQHELTGLANAVFISHLESTNQALRLLMALPKEHQKEIEALNAFQYRLERWTDMLLSNLPECRLAARYSFNRNRMLDFAIDRGQQSIEQLRRSSQLFLASFIADLRNNTGKYPASPDLNRQLASGVLEFLTSARFDSTGQLKSSYLIRLEKDRKDIESLVGQLSPLFDFSTENSNSSTNQGDSPPKSRLMDRDNGE